VTALRWLFLGTANPRGAATCGCTRPGYYQGRAVNAILRSLGARIYSSPALAEHHCGLSTRLISSMATLIRRPWSQSPRRLAPRSEARRSLVGECVLMRPFGSMFRFQRHYAAVRLQCIVGECVAIDLSFVLPIGIPSSGERGLSAIQGEPQVLPLLSRVPSSLCCGSLLAIYGALSKPGLVLPRSEIATVSCSSECIAQVGSWSA
jgi:hypothetical protein